MSNIEVDEDDEFFDVVEGEMDLSFMDGSGGAGGAFKMKGGQTLEKIGQWLLSIPRDDILALHKTCEYAEFIKSFERLGHAHRRSVQLEVTEDQQHFFLQHMAVDDVVLRVLEFLECQSLLKTSQTCSRFRDLATTSATQRTYDIQKHRHLQNVFQVLRAKEQMEGSCLESPSVPVPILGLPKRILVSNAGDVEYNGIYHCTGCDGNGFVFTKPRNTESRASFSTQGSWLQQAILGDDVAANSAGNAEDGAQPGQLLRCIIAKRFSNETILWYMSKEIETRTEEGVPQISQVFSFWAKLMILTGGDTAGDISRYPSQTSILSANGDLAWQALTGTRTMTPPTVELLP